MSKHNIFFGGAMVVAAVAWYLFRPELLLLNTWPRRPSRSNWAVESPNRIQRW